MRLDRQIPLILPFHTTPGEYKAEPGIVAASDIGKLMTKIPRDSGVSYALLRLETHYTSTPGSEQAPGAGLGRSFGSILTESEHSLKNSIDRIIDIGRKCCFKHSKPF